MRTAVENILEYGSILVFGMGVTMIVEYVVNNYHNFGSVLQNIFQVWANIL